MKHALVGQVPSHWNLVLIEVLVEQTDTPLALTDTLVVVGYLISFLDPFDHETNIL